MHTLRSLDWCTPPLRKHKLIHSSTGATLRREHQHVHDTQRRTVTRGDWERGEGCPCEGWVTSVLWSALAGTWMGFYSCMQYIRGKGLGLQKLHLPWCTSASHQRSHKHTLHVWVDFTWASFFFFFGYGCNCIIFLI